MKKRFIKELYKTWVTDRPNQLAAALAYYGMFSFAPIIFIAVSIVGLFIEKIDPTELLFQRLEERFGAEISSLVQSTITTLSTPSSNTSWLISVISFLALLYTASGLFYQLQFSLNKIWHVPPLEKGQTTSFIRQRFLSFIIVIGFGFLGVIAIFAEVLLSGLGSIMESLVGFQFLAARFVVPIILILIIALFYKILPETKVAWRDVWLGAILSTILILAALFLAGLFFQYSSFNSALQAAGAFTMLLVGFYYIAQIFLLGAVCCRVYADLYGSRRSNEI